MYFTINGYKGQNSKDADLQLYKISLLRPVQFFVDVNNVTFYPSCFIPCDIYAHCTFIHCDFLPQCCDIKPHTVVKFHKLTNKDKQRFFRSFCVMFVSKEFTRH